MNKVDCIKTGHQRLGDAYPRVQLMNAYVHDISMDDLIQQFDHGLLLTLHVDMIMKLQTDREFYNIIDEFDIVTCDSQILYFATKFLGMPVRERISGSDFFPKYYMHHRANMDVRIFICGGKPGVAEIARDRINAKVGREIIVGVNAPSAGFDKNPAELDKVLDEINASGATVLMVGLGGGRQEKFIVAHRHRLPGVHTYLPLGGTIDYEAGTFARPPAWITNWGFEWLYRLLREPRQRFHRYVIHEPPVLYHLMRQKLGIYRNPFSEKQSQA